MRRCWVGERHAEQRGRFPRFYYSLGLMVALIAGIEAISLAQPAEEQRSAAAGTVRTWSDPGLAPISSAGPPQEKIIPIGRLDPQKDQRPPSSSGLAPKTERDPGVTGLQSSASTVQSAAPTAFTNFQGVDNEDNSSECFFIARPPDPHMAVGQSHVVVVTNVLLAVYSKSGTLLNIACLENWFSNVHDALNDGGVFDPRIAYDSHQGRWIIVALARDSTPEQSWYLVSVSQTSDPTGSWWNWRLNGLLNAPATDNANTWADYPDVGFDGISSASGGAIYVTANTFKFSGGFGTNALNILPKSSLYNGSSFSYWMAWGRNNGAGFEAFTIRTAHVWDSSRPGFLINTVGSFGGSQVSLWRVNPTFPPTAIDWTLQATLNIGSYSGPPLATQSGCADMLDTIDNRIYNAVVRNGKIYGAFTEGFNFGSGTVAAIRYLKADVITNAVNLDVRFGANGIHHWFPAISVDSSDNIVLVYARSSSSTFASVYYTGRKTTDSTTQAGALLKAGEECITGFRWGDYFGAATDPANPSRIWIFGEWAANLPTTDSVWDWSTWVGEVGFAPSGNPDPTTAEFTVRNDGTVAADRAYFCGLASGCFNTGSGADLAERIDVTEPVEPGDVIELDPEMPRHYRKAREPNSPLVAGVIASVPGIILANQPEESARWASHESILSFESGLLSGLLQRWGNVASPMRVTLSSLSGMGIPLQRFSIASLSQRTAELERWTGRPLMALMGRVYVKATTENGPIRAGDLLVSAFTPGHAMRCSDRCAGAIIGKAVEPLDQGTGVIEILIMR